MGMKEDTQALNAIPVKAVGEFLGLSLPIKGSARCPFTDHDDNNPSFVINSVGQRWKCFGCDRTGGAIDLVKFYLGCSFLDAKKWLAHESGLISSAKRNKRSSIPRKEESYFDKKTPIETKPDHELYAALLAKSPLLKTGENYLCSRGIKAEIIDRFTIGQVPSMDILRGMVTEFSYERFEASGLLTKQSQPKSFHFMFSEGALLFPYFENELPSYFQARVIDNRSNRKRWCNLSNRSTRTYNTDILNDSSIERLAICEGAIDVLSATQLGCEAIGLMGVSARLTDVEMTSLRGKQVDLFLDWDEPGEVCAAKLRTELARFGVAATRKSAPPSGAKDINEYLQEVNTGL